MASTMQGELSKCTTKGNLTKISFLSQREMVKAEDHGRVGRTLGAKHEAHQDAEFVPKDESLRCCWNILRIDGYEQACEFLCS